ncbi:zinc-finger-containing protein [Spongiimicrobium salis]|uniref:zinc-finger-containing protein n=1 Tax=Spongiimicrobium salis TaxID=1667022 RepID=UPI00374CAE0C
MTLTPLQQDILSAKVCPYCKSRTKVVSEEFIYGKTYRNRSMICCDNYPQCDSYVGTHDDGEPLGRLADKKLRQWKRKAHDAFDRIWKEKHMERNAAYEEMADAIGIPDKFCHIGMFQVKTCIKVVAWAKLKYAELI